MVGTGTNVKVGTAAEPTRDALRALLKRAAEALGHGNASPSGQARVATARRLGAGRWHGSLDLEQLMGSPGYVVARGLVDVADCATLLAAAKRRFGSAPLHRAARRAKDRLRDLRRLAGVKVHAKLTGGTATLHGLARAGCDLDADAAWARAVRRVAGHVGHAASQSQDEALHLGACGLADQRWHTDSTASLAYVVALSDADATQYVPAAGRAVARRDGVRRPQTRRLPR